MGPDRNDAQKKKKERLSHGGFQNSLPPGPGPGPGPRPRPECCHRIYRRVLCGLLRTTTCAYTFIPVQEHQYPMPPPVMGLQLSPELDSRSSAALSLTRHCEVLHQHVPRPILVGSPAASCLLVGFPFWCNQEKGITRKKYVCTCWPTRLTTDVLWASCVLSFSYFLSRREGREGEKWEFWPI
jgi:hypothetical protein